MTASIVVWGAGGHANVVVDAIRVAGAGKVEALYDDVSTDGVAERHGLPVWRNPDRLRERAAKGDALLHVAVGDCAARARIAASARAMGFELLSVRHPAAVVSPSAQVGAGAFLAAGSVVGPSARLGAGVIVNTRASVDHDCAVDDWAHVAPGATLGGRVEVGRESWIGLGASVREGVRIGARAMIGAGAVVLRDIGDDLLAYGVPARIIRRLR